MGDFPLASLLPVRGPSRPFVVSFPPPVRGELVEPHERAIASPPLLVRILRHAQALLSPVPFASFDRLRTNGWLMPVHAPCPSASFDTLRTNGRFHARSCSPLPVRILRHAQDERMVDARSCSLPVRILRHAQDERKIPRPFVAPSRPFVVSPPPSVRGEPVEPHERAIASPHPLASFDRLRTIGWRCGPTPASGPSPAA